MGVAKDRSVHRSRARAGSGPRPWLCRAGIAALLVAASLGGLGALDEATHRSVSAYAADPADPWIGRIEGAAAASEEPLTAPGAVGDETAGEEPLVWWAMTRAGVFVALTGLVLLVIRGATSGRSGRNPARAERPPRTGARPSPPQPSPPQPSPPKRTQPQPAPPERTPPAPTPPERIRPEPTTGPRRFRRLPEPVESVPERPYRISLLGGDPPDIPDALERPARAVRPATIPDQVMEIPMTSPPRIGTDDTTEFVSTLARADRVATPPQSAPAPAAEMVVMLGPQRVTVRLNGSRTAAAAYAWGEAAGFRLPLCLGESPSGALYIDAGQCPDVLTISGVPEARLRAARGLLERLEVTPSAPLVTVIGATGADDVPARYRHLARLDQLRGAPDPAMPQLLFCLSPRDEDGPLLRHLIEASRGAIVPIVVGEVSPARWSLHVDPAPRPDPEPTTFAGAAPIAGTAPKVLTELTPPTGTGGGPSDWAGPQLRRRKMWLPSD